MSDFVSFARANGLVLDHAIADGRWHRCPTRHKPRKKNGAYLWDGHRGVARDWADLDFALYREDGAQRRTPSREEVRRDIVAAQRATERKHERAAALAAELIDSCIRARHAYLARKGFHDLEGLVHWESKDLVVPMRDLQSYRIIGAQRINPQGEKLFIPGQRATAAVFAIGAERAAERWLVEGYVTGLSVKAALDSLRRPARVVVCFSAGNLTHVAARVPRPAFVFADNDESRTGERSAIETGLPWTMSEIVGFDANDHHRECGLVDVCRLVRAATLS